MKTIRKTMLSGESAIICRRRVYVQPKIEICRLEALSCMLAGSPGTPGGNEDYNDLGDF